MQEKLTTSLNIRMTQDMRAKLERLAAEDNRKPGDYVRLVLCYALEQQIRRDEEEKKKLDPPTARIL
jgi:hypothetical protein